MDDKWKSMKFWSSGEWQVILERLADLDANKIKYCPNRMDLFAALDAVEFDNVRVMVVGQDPYPDPRFATGVAFSVPSNIHADDFPPALDYIYKELVNDYIDTSLYPTTGDLTKWCKQGVLLWNAIPTCQAWKSLSHESWSEWPELTKEIVELLSAKGIVFYFLGRVAQEYMQFVDTSISTVGYASYPVPRVSRQHPFIGCRMFSTINAMLVGEHGFPAINWRL